MRVRSPAHHAILQAETSEVQTLVPARDLCRVVSGTLGGLSSTVPVAGYWGAFALAWQFFLRRRALEQRLEF